MNHCNGRLILKVKKRRSYVQLPKKHVSTEKENLLTPQQRPLKRANPFSKFELEPKEKIKIADCELVNNDNKSAFLSGLQSCNEKVTEKNNNNTIYQIPQNEDTDKKPENEKEVYDYQSHMFPLDWSIKQRARFFSTGSFKCDLKSSNESKGIYQFTRNLEDVPQISQYLYNWVHPSIPGVPNYPLKTTSLGGVTKDQKICINMLANNRELQELTMKQWRVSFQSLFNMLKTLYCPYFYLCCHQFTVLFKAAGINGKSLTAVIGPTTKGLRDLLSEEGLNFEFIHKSPTSQSKEVEFGFEEEQVNTPSSLNASCDEDFFDSIGLDKKEHFPQMQQQERLSLRSKLHLLDNRPESIIKIKNCNGLFNFLLNATFLCASSGAMTGVPPTLISPSSFEGATLNKCKVNNGPLKQQKKATSTTVHTIDVSGFLLPSQLYNLSRVLTEDRIKNAVTIHLKTFDSLQCFTGAGNKEEDSNDNVKTTSKCFISDDLAEHLNQSSVAVTDSTEITFKNGCFCF